MPTWCENDLLIKGKRNDIKMFLEYVKGKQKVPGCGERPLLFDFSKIIPYPQEFSEMEDADGFSSEGYIWCIANWGTGWDPVGVTIEELQGPEENCRGKITFATAEMPPNPIIRAASLMFPTLEFDLRWFECNRVVNGVFMVKNGEVRWQAVGDYFGFRGGQSEWACLAHCAERQEAMALAQSGRPEEMMMPSEV